MNISNCKNCGYKLFDEEKFCSYCGTKKKHIPLVNYDELKPELGFKEFFNIYNQERIDKFTYIFTGIFFIILSLLLSPEVLLFTILTIILFGVYYKARNNDSFFARIASAVAFFPFFLFQTALSYLIKAFHFPKFKKRWEDSYWQKTMVLEEKLKALQSKRSPISEQINYLSQNEGTKERTAVLETMQKVDKVLLEKIQQFTQMINMIELNYFSNQFAGRIKKIQEIKTETDYEFEIQEMKKLQKELHRSAEKLSKKAEAVTPAVIERYNKLDTEIEKVIERLENNRAMLLLEDIDLLEMKMKQKQFMGDFYNDDYLKNIFLDDMDKIWQEMNLSEDTSARIDAELDVAKKYL